MDLADQAGCPAEWTRTTEDLVSQTLSETPYTTFTDETPRCGSNKKVESRESGRKSGGMNALNDELNSQDDPESCEQPLEAEKPASVREIDELRQKNEEYLEKVKRLQAEFDNYKKRAAKEREETVQLATARLVKELLQLADNFERALANSKNPNDSDLQSQGLKMMYWQLMDILRGEGVTEIETKCKLDPFQHEVMTKVDDPAHADDEIIECVQKGYRMKGKVIRPARVIVCRREVSSKCDDKVDDGTNHDGSCECEEEIEDNGDREVN